ncbi:MAG: flippase [Chloroflexota bacterium]
MKQSSSLAQFITGTLFTGAGKFMVMVLGIFGLAITTRILTPAEVGLYVLLLAIVIFLSEISSIGLNFAIPKFLPGIEDEDEERLTINTILIFRLFTIVVISVVAFLIAKPLFTLFSATVPATTELLIYISVLVALESIGKLLIAILQGHFKFKTIGLTNTISSMVNFGGILLFVLYFQLGLVGLILAKLASRVIAYGYALLSANLDLRLELDVPILKKLLIFGFPLQINYIMSFIFQRMDVFLIATFLGPLQVGLYEIARRIPDSLAEAYEAFVQVFFPFLSKFSETGENDELTQMLNVSLRWLVFTLLTGAMIAFTFGTEIITLLFSDQYTESGMVFGIVMVSFTIVVLDSTQGYTLIAVGKASKIPQINFVRTLISFVGYFLLIPPLGIVGAAMAGPIAMAMVNPAVVWFLRRSNVAVDYRGYLVSFAIFFTLLACYFGFDMNSILERILLTISFVVANIMLSVVTWDEIRYGITEGYALIERTLAKRHEKNKRTPISNTVDGA